MSVLNVVAQNTLKNVLDYLYSRQVNIVPINDQAIPQPGGQYMVRDTTTPMPDDSCKLKRTYSFL